MAVADSALASSVSVTLLVPLAEAGVRLDRFVTAALAEVATRGAEAGRNAGAGLNADAGGNADAGFGAVPRGISRARLQALVAEGRVTIDGRPVERNSLVLCGGETIVISIPAPVPITLAPESMPLDILYEDGDLIALAKPAGLTVHPGAGRQTGTLASGLLAHCRDLSGIGGALRPGIVHRLDRGTSGVLVVAKHDRAHQGLAAQFASRTVTKRYVAFVLGTPVKKTATLDTLYGRHPTERKRFSSKVKSGKRAVTTYTVVASGGGITRLDVLLGTGRTHQIRVHLADLGHPVVGDATYGGTRLDRVRDKDVRAAALALGRQALHAAELEVVHPCTGARMHFVAPLPDDLARLWRAMQE